MTKSHLPMSSETFGTMLNRCYDQLALQHASLSPAVGLLRALYNPIEDEPVPLVPLRQTVLGALDDIDECNTLLQEVIAVFRPIVRDVYAEFMGPTTLVPAAQQKIAVSYSSFFLRTALKNGMDMIGESTFSVGHTTYRAVRDNETLSEVQTMLVDPEAVAWINLWLARQHTLDVVGNRINRCSHALQRMGITR